MKDGARPCPNTQPPAASHADLWRKSLPDRCLETSSLLSRNKKIKIESPPSGRASAARLHQSADGASFPSAGPRPLKGSGPVNHELKSQNSASLIGRDGFTEQMRVIDLGGEELRENKSENCPFSSRLAGTDATNEEEKEIQRSDGGKFQRTISTIYSNI